MEKPVKKYFAAFAGNTILNGKKITGTISDTVEEELLDAYRAMSKSNPQNFDLYEITIKKVKTVTITPTYEVKNAKATE